MRFIPTRVHGMLDYGIGLLLIVAPWLLGFAEGGAETWIPVILGIGTILYSLFTDYELGFISRSIPMSAHLGIDAAAGVLLLVSPWLFGFSELVIWPHVIVGLLEIGAAIMTHAHPDDRTAGVHHPAHA